VGSRCPTNGSKPGARNSTCSSARSTSTGCLSRTGRFASSCPTNGAAPSYEETGTAAGPDATDDSDSRSTTSNHRAGAAETTWPTSPRSVPRTTRSWSPTAISYSKATPTSPTDCRCGASPLRNAAANDNARRPRPESRAANPSPATTLRRAEHRWPRAGRRGSTVGKESSGQGGDQEVGLVRYQSTVRARPSSREVQGFQPRWMAARPGSRQERPSSPTRAGARWGVSA